ncbi:diacylglycerol/lipid kinase family protein [Herbiconiux sp. UC225_62]|uniref:diacylglycerol/lipid kinase family protein n=1 Tax=Herbiconiux sp. UC225_62 TaxID=3350168 RepID=UPI0036D27CDB
MNTAPPIAAIVYNPTKVDLTALRTAVDAQEAEAGWGPSLWLETAIHGPGQGVTRTAVPSGAAVVIAVGGDGTIRAVAEGLRGSGVPLGLVPAGTGNLFARNLTLTLNDLTGAIATAFTGESRPVDLGLVKLADDGIVTEHVFLVMTGLGIDARMIDDTDDVLKKRVGWLAYARAVAAALRQTRQLTGRYRLDGAPPRGVRANTIMIGNCGLLPANILLLPDAEVDDGLFEVVLLRPTSPWGWAQIMAKVFWENGARRRTAPEHRGAVHEVRSLRYRLGRRIDIRLDEPHRVEIDGDGFGTADAVSAWIEPEGLTVRVPGLISPTTGVSAAAGRH